MLSHLFHWVKNIHKAVPLKAWREFTRLTRAVKKEYGGRALKLEGNVRKLEN